MYPVSCLDFAQDSCENSPPFNTIEFDLLSQASDNGYLIPLQEAAGFFFCLEDRALLCRKCDVAIHTANAYVSTHQRFLLTGVKVGLDLAETGPSPSSVNSQAGGKISGTKSTSASKGAAQVPLHVDHNGALPMRQDAEEKFAPSKLALSGGSAAGSIQSWNLDDFLGLTEYNHTYNYMDNGPSKVINYFDLAQYFMFNFSVRVSSKGT